jgi:hypothetical protein
MGIDWRGAIVEHRFLQGLRRCGESPVKGPMVLADTPAAPAAHLHMEFGVRLY